MFTHTRTVMYLLASGVIWFAEDAVFTMAFHFNVGQTAVVTAYFVALFAAAIWWVVRMLQSHRPERFQTGELPFARLVSMAPALTLIVGSFAALPVFILVLIAGALL